MRTLLYSHELSAALEQYGATEMLTCDAAMSIQQGEAPITTTADGEWLHSPLNTLIINILYI